MVMRGTLRKKPLLEAVFELRWKSRIEDTLPSSVDPDYSFLVGLFQGAVKNDFPFPVRLPASQIPAELVNYVAQYQFRVADGAWPLVQLGPGLLTVNETTTYVWKDHFERYCVDLIRKLVDVHPNAGQLSPYQAQLRFINGLNVDDDNDVLEELKRQLNTRIGLPNDVIQSVGSDSAPNGLQMAISFPLQQPSANLTISMSKARSNEKNVIMFDISVISAESQLESFFDDYNTWLQSAHDVAESVFFGFLSDDLLERFEYEPDNE